MDELSDGLFTTPEMAAAFSPAAHVRGMLAFEAALARAEARAGVIPPQAADAIAAECRVELFDVAALYREATTAGTPAIPLVRMLTERVAEDARGVGQHHEFLGSEMGGDRGGGGIRVDIQPTAIGVNRQRRNHGHDAGGAIGEPPCGSRVRQLPYSSVWRW